MIRLNIHEIKARFSKYIELVEAGDTVVVCKRNVPVAEIRPVEIRKPRKPVLGSAKGMITIALDFDGPLADEHLWYGALESTAPKPRTSRAKKRDK